MAWRKPAVPPRIEPPLWYRVYDPAAWDAPDAQEQRMMDGCRSMGPWPADLHGIHARRRWQEAKHAYRRDRQDLADQELEDLLARRYGRDSSRVSDGRQWDNRPC